MLTYRISRTLKALRACAHQRLFGGRTLPRSSSTGGPPDSHLGQRANSENRHIPHPVRDGNTRAARNVGLHIRSGLKEEHHSVGLLIRHMEQA